jgi:hypothetical protein
VHHLWRQFKAFGNKADAAAGDSANGCAPGGGRGGACFGEAFDCGRQLDSTCERLLQQVWTCRCVM